MSQDAVFKAPEQLHGLYAAHKMLTDAPIVTDCRIGERSAHTWFVLHELLGHPDVSNYDGSWTEWGSMTAMPIQLGHDPGRLADGFTASDKPDVERAEGRSRVDRVGGLPRLPTKKV